MNPLDFHGIYTAMITPFDAEGQFDKTATRNVVKRQVEAGVTGIIPAGTTGESPTLREDELASLFRICVQERGAAKVIAGIGSNDTRKSLEMLEIAEQAGADAVMVVVPYYSKPSQAGIFAHIAAIATQTQLPVMIYNVPSRTAVSIAIDTVAALKAKHGNVFAIKDAESTALERVVFTRMQCGKEFVQLSGDDATFPGFLAMGGHGLVSVSSNVAPKLAVALYEAWKHSQWEEFAKTRDAFIALHGAIFSEPTPALIKHALSLMEVCGPTARLPSAPATEEGKARMAGIMRTIAEWV